MKGNKFLELQSKFLRKYFNLKIFKNKHYFNINENSGKNFFKRSLEIFNNKSAESIG